MVLAIALTGLCTVSCGGDDDDDENENESSITANDPEGTIIANLTNTFYEHGWYWYEGINNMNGGKYTYLGMNSSNNLEAQNSGGGDAKIVSLGKVKNLSSIKKIPESGWTHQVAAVPGYGYVYRSSTWEGDVYYARIYAVDYMISTTGGIMGITIKYQEKWEPNTK